MYNMRNNAYAVQRAKRSRDCSPCRYNGRYMCVIITLLWPEFVKLATDAPIKWFYTYMSVCDMSSTYTLTVTLHNIIMYTGTCVCVMVTARHGPISTVSIAKSRRERRSQHTASCIIIILRFNIEHGGCSITKKPVNI